VEGDKFLDIMSAFNNSTFKGLISQLPAAVLIPITTLDTVLKETMLQGKSDELREVVEQYGFMFILEMRHFLTVHRLVEP
jgi:hypothetical protein